MLLQGYFDDSGSDPKSPLFLLGGLMATVDQWKAFSFEWDKKLKEEPAIRHFKMSEAHSFTGEFKRGWTPTLRDQKVFELAEIVPKYAKARIDCLIYREVYDKFIKGTMYTEAANNPYFHLFYSLVLAVARTCVKFNIADEVDYIFDAQGQVGVDALVSWRAMRDATPPPFQKFMDNVPVFRDDRKFLPLQAADMYAWTARENKLDRQGKILSLRPIRKQFLKIPGTRANLTKQHAIELGASLMVARAKLLGLLQ